MEGKMEGIRLLFGRLMQKAIQAGGDVCVLGRTVALEALLTRATWAPAESGTLETRTSFITCKLPGLLPVHWGASF